MQMITSAAGTRLAKAQRALDAYSIDDLGNPYDTNYEALLDEWIEAATALGNELIEQGYHDLDGGEG